MPRLLLQHLPEVTLDDPMWIIGHAPIFNTLEALSNTWDGHSSFFLLSQYELVWKARGKNAWQVWLVYWASEARRARAWGRIIAPNDAAIPPNYLKHPTHKKFQRFWKILKWNHFYFLFVLWCCHTPQLPQMTNTQKSKVFLSKKFQIWWEDRKLCKCCLSIRLLMMQFLQILWTSSLPKSQSVKKVQNK